MVNQSEFSDNCDSGQFGRNRIAVWKTIKPDACTHQINYSVISIVSLRIIGIHQKMCEAR